MAALDSSLELARSNEREAKARFELGQRTKIDVLRTSANVLSLESKRLGYEQQKTASYNSLKEYGGLQDEEISGSGLPGLLKTEAGLVEVIETFSRLPSAPGQIESFLTGRAPSEESEKKLSTQISEASPSYRAITLAEEAEQARAKQATVLDWPELLLQGSIYKQSPEWGSAFTWRSHSYSFGEL